MGHALAEELVSASLGDNHHLKTVLDALPAAVYATDADGVLTYANRAAEEMAGKRAEIGRDKWCVSWRLYHPDGTPLPLDQCPMSQALREGRPIRGAEIVVERPDGTRALVTPYPTPLFDKAGKLVGAVNLLVDVSDRKRTQGVLASQNQRLDVLNRIGKTLAGDLDLERIIQLVTDSATTLSGAKYGAFFYNTVDERGETYQLYALSGAPRSAFEKFGMPRNTEVFATTFGGKGIVRSDDIRADPRYGKNAPHRGMPEGHLPVVSYLAVPVVSRAGEVLGGLFLGHDSAGVFTKETEEVVAGIAAHASIAIDNSRLFQRAKRETEERRRTEYAARQLAAIVQYSDDAIMGKNLDSIVTSWNPGEQRLFGYTADEMVGKPVTTLFPPGHLDEETAILDRIKRGESVDHYETVRRRKDGTLIDVSLTVSPIKDDRGHIVGASKIARDIGDRKRADSMLAKRVDELATLYDLTNGLHRAESLADMNDAALRAILRAVRCDRASILLFDDTGVMRFVASQGLSENYRAAVEGHSPWTPTSTDAAPIMVPDVDKADLEVGLKATVKGEGIGALAFIPLVGAGRVVGKFMIYYNAPHIFADSEITLAASIAHQFTFGLTRQRAEDARRRAEAELRANEERERARAAELQAIMEAAPVSIWIARDPDCATITGNRSANAFLGIPANTVLSAQPGKWPTHFDMFSEGEPMSLAELPVQRAARGEEVRNAEGELRFKDGTTRFLLGNATPLKDASGKPYGAVAAFVDITERKRTEEALREREAELEIIINRTPFMLTRCTRDLRYGIVSQAYARMLGRKPEEIAGKPIAEILGEESLRAILPHIQSVLEGNRVEFEDEIPLPGVGPRFLHVVYTPERDERGSVTGWIASILDVSERKRAESQRDLLVAELSHRVKNTLATVVSIARQSFAKNPNVGEARRSFDSRILALAQTHTRLAETSWSGVLFETLLRDELAPYRRDDGQNIRMSGPPVALSPRCVLTLGMAIHELVTNAAKYGALSIKEGVVDIAWDVDHERMRIVWKESDGPPVAPPNRSGFGRQLLERATTAGLRGTVKMDFAPSGVTCTMTIPLGDNIMALT